MTTNTVTITVSRGIERETLADTNYQVPFSDGMSVLDALIWIRENRDPSLAVRYSCINANACKECSVLVDGEITYACTARLSGNSVRVTPMEDKKLVKDVVTDIVNRKEKISLIESKKMAL